MAKKVWNKDIQSTLVYRGIKISKQQFIDQFGHEINLSINFDDSIIDENLLGMGKEFSFQRGFLSTSKDK